MNVEMVPTFKNHPVQGQMGEHSQHRNNCIKWGLIVYFLFYSLSYINKSGSKSDRRENFVNSCSIYEIILDKSALLNRDTD